MDYVESIRFLFAEQDRMANEAEEGDMDSYLEDIRFLFEAEDTAAEQDTMADDMDDYLEDIRFLFDAEQDTSSLEEDNIAAGDTKRVKWVKDAAERLKKMKKGVKKFFGRLGETVRRGFCCCVSVEE